MKLTPEERLFVQTGLKLGYLHADMFSDIQASLRNKRTDIARFLVKHSYLSANQAEQIQQAMKNEIFHRTEILSHAEPPSSSAGGLSSRNEKEMEESVGPGGPHGVDLTGPGICVGQTWEGMDILAEIGRGGMGIVYKALQQGTNRIVALKVMSGAAFATAAQTRRFLREARATARLNHPHIVEIYTMADKGEYSYFTMQYIEGESFESLQKRDISLPEKLAALAKIAGALHHAHRHQILHRDIKPSNILIDRAGEPYLTDFGLAKILDTDSRLTQSGQTLGTPFYMSPEQVRGDRSKIGPASDVYSLGVILYQTLTGRLPFVADTLAELYHKITREDPPPLSSCASDTPAPLQAICRSAMDRSPQFRYRTAAELERDIRRFLSGKRVEAAKFDLPRWTVSLVRRLGRSAWLILVFGVIAIVACAIALWPDRSNRNWQHHWRSSLQHFEKEEYVESLRDLNALKNHPRPQELDAMREKICRKIEERAYESFQKKDYSNALRFLDCLPRLETSALKLRADSLESLARYAEMRLTLSQIYEMNPDADTLHFIGTGALRVEYFSDAVHYFEAALSIDPGNAGLQKELAWALLLGGNYRRARDCYRQFSEESVDPMVRLGRSQIFLWEKQPKKALVLVRELEASPGLRARALLLSARARWRMCEKDLMNWKWLAREDVSSREKLQEIENELRQACRTLEQGPPLSPLEKSLLRDIRFYSQALEFEKAEEPKFDVLHHFESTVAESISSPRTRIFFARVMIRFLIRNREWQRAYEICNTSLGDFPWVPDFYHLRALVRFQCGEIQQAMLDLEKSLSLDRWDFLPLDNMSHLIFECMTQEEFREFVLVILNRFLFGRPPAVMREMFQELLADLREKVWQNEEFLGSSVRPVENWDELLDQALMSESRSVRELAMRMLADRHDDPELMRKMEAARTRCPDAQKQRIREISAAMEQKRREGTMRELRRLLLNYFVLRENQYLVRIDRLGEEGEGLLIEILRSPSQGDLMRLFAAQALLALGKRGPYLELREIAVGREYPTNLLAFVALREANFTVDFPELSTLEIFSGEDEDAREAPFCRMLLALHIEPERNPELASSLLQDRTEMVSLCAACNLRTYTNLPAPLSREAVEERLLELLQSESPDIRAKACRIFWDFEEVGRERPEEERENARNACRKDCWQKHHGLIVSALRDPAMDVRIAAIRSIIGDLFTKEGMTLPEIARTSSAGLTVEILRVIYRDSSYFVRFWSAAVLSTLDSKEEVDRIIDDSDLPFSIRLACSRIYRTCGRMTEMESAFSFVNFAQRKVHSESDRILKQLALIGIGWYAGVEKHLASNQMVLQHIHTLMEQSVRDPDAHIRRTAVVGLMWGGTGRHIRLFRDRMSSQDLHMQRAAACALAYSILRYAPGKMPRFKESIYGLSEPVRKAAAYGCYEVVRSEVSHTPMERSNIQFEKGYDLYLEHFREKMTHPDTDLSLWQESLQNAVLLAPCSQYCYESAILDFQRGALDDALQKAYGALRHAEKEHAAGESQVNYQKIRCLRLLGEIHLGRQQDGAARKSFEAALEEFPFDSRCHSHMADICVRTRDLSAEKTYRWRAYLCDPSNKIAPE